MQKNSHPFTAVAVRVVAVAALLASITFASVQVVAAKASAEDRVEGRITELHTQLNITPAQEDPWSKVAQVMRDNAKTLDALTQLRVENAKTMTAVDDLKSYGEITAAHAEGIQKLTAVFEVFYNSLSDAQKKDGDEAFRHGHRPPHAHHRHH